MKRHSEKGSALLIVLGFLSFMVVSAVAFAVWMRTERIPSSVLRRNVANRYLVKAALAQAMSQVDDAIRSHVYPGAWNTNDTQYGTSNVRVYRDGADQAYDCWEARVFMPPDPEGHAQQTGGGKYSRYAPISKTVSVLNLEALGYLPPAIVNDVRLLHRSSWAAKWDYFNFDAGRYAFCAVNVSDMLDVNKLSANVPRTSAAHFSGASLFRSGDDNFSSIDTTNAKIFDECVHENRAEWNSAPLVSLLDYNLSIGERTDGNEAFWSPFCRLASGKNDSGLFYFTGDALRKSAERQPFVTDSWYPKSAVEVQEPLDISKNQPFEMSDLKLGNSQTMLEVFNKTSTGNVPFWDPRIGSDKKSGLCWLDIFTLYDYLDEDSVPLSLNMPCVERVPMLAAVEPLLKLDFSFTPGESPNPKIQGSVAEVETPMLIEIKVDAGRSFLNSLFVFPFKEGQTPPDGCTAEAFARVVFVCEPKGNVTTSSALPLKLRNNALAKFKPLTKDEWNGSVQNQFQLDSGNGGGLQRPAVPDCLLLTLPSNGEVPIGNLSPNDEKGVARELKFKDGTFKSTTPIITTISEHSVSTVNGVQGAGPPKGTPPKYRIGLRPFDVDTGDLFNKIDITKDLSQEEFDNFCGAYDIRPYLLVWARIKDKDGKTIDLVPATAQDDQILNDINNSLDPRSTIVFGESLGMSEGNDSNSIKLPILRFGCANTFSYASAVPASGGAGGGGGAPSQLSMVSWMPRAFFTVDPRFNWAPEDWYAWSENDSDRVENLWYKNLFDNGILNGHKDKAQDPFLFVSNQGYLQSVGELCFLPRLSRVDESKDVEYNVVGCKNIEGTGAKYDLYDGVERSKGTVNTMPSWRAAWTFYQNIRTNPDVLEFGANMYRRGVVNGSQGMYVNPFTQSHEVMLTALANTPLNYWVTSTNTVFSSDVRHQESKDFGDSQKWTFGEGGQGAQIRGEDIHKIATFLQHRFEDLASMVEITDYSEQTLYALQNLWTDMFDALDWNGKLGLTVKDVYDDLEDYYKNSGGFGSKQVSYSKTYSGESYGYQALNRRVVGSGTVEGRTAGIRLHPDRAIHKDDFSKSADPLAGEVAGGSGTQCRDEFDHIDRMFLHSYWRDCFANRQQLFLIFVRAEATALGAAGEGTPPQQGGRAVALIWRDPLPVMVDNEHNADDLDEDEKKATYTNSGKNSGITRCPHRMRILFYRQFD